MKKSATNDTSPEAEEVQMELLRNMSGQERVNKALALSAQVMRMSKAAIRRRHPEFSDDEVNLKFIEMTYGRELATEVREWMASRQRHG